MKTDQNKTHTPGPWISGVTRKQTLMVYGPQNQTIAEIRTKQANALANTYLIAAAPDLLEALQELLPMWESGIEEPWVKRAREAIAKATGGKPDAMV